MWVWVALLVLCEDKEGSKIVAAFYLWACPARFGTVDLRPRTAAGPSRGDVATGHCTQSVGWLAARKRGKLYQFYPGQMGRGYCLLASRCKPGECEKPPSSALPLHCGGITLVPESCKCDKAMGMCSGHCARSNPNTPAGCWFVLFHLCLNWTELWGRPLRFSACNVTRRCRGAGRSNVTLPGWSCQ